MACSLDTVLKEGNTLHPAREPSLFEEGTILEPANPVVDIGLVAEAGIVLAEVAREGKEPGLEAVGIIPVEGTVLEQVVIDLVEGTVLADL
jgi:hypothetical protein